MALNLAKCHANNVKMIFFSKNYKNCLAPIVSAKWGSAPQTPACDTLEVRQFTQHAFHWIHFSTQSNFSFEIKSTPLNKILVTSLQQIELKTVKKIQYE